MEIVSMILHGLLAATFLMAGLGKVSGSKMHVEGFQHWRLPQWFRVTTGLVELVAAISLIVGFWINDWATFGAALLAITAIGGVLTHVRVKDSIKETLPIIVLGLLAFGVLFLNL
ncbi:DoxX family protein [Viridibacillus sp. NPDC096237]|uniref:DoxX family protein n=1 Tax=Viridibacillus sp. NPDC096237 TaxID=3390721 RepID=UPI003CFCCAD4